MATEGGKFVDENQNQSEMRPIEEGLEQFPIDSPTAPPPRPHLLWNSKKSRSHPVQMLQNFSYLAKFNDRLSQLNHSKTVGSYLDTFRVQQIATISEPDLYAITALELQPTSTANVIGWGDCMGNMYVLPIDKPADQLVLLDDVKPVVNVEQSQDYIIGAIKWDSSALELIYAVSWDRGVQLYNIETQRKFDIWSVSGISWDSLDESLDYRVVVAGNNDGNVVAIDKRSHTPVWQHSFNYEICEHLEFNRSATWLLASGGNTTKLWDIRMFRKNWVRHGFVNDNMATAQPTHEVGSDEHNCVGDNVVFNNGGDLLLTRDYPGNIHVYQGPIWRKIFTIHSHGRLYRDAIPAWHPWLDVIFIGRSRDLNSTSWPVDHQTVDVFCGRTGQLITRMFSPLANDVSKIAKMNPCGSMLACVVQDRCSRNYSSKLAFWTPQIPSNSSRETPDRRSNRDGSEN